MMFWDPCVFFINFIFVSLPHFIGRLLQMKWISSWFLAHIFEFVSARAHYFVFFFYRKIFSLSVNFFVCLFSCPFVRFSPSNMFMNRFSLARFTYCFNVPLLYYYIVSCLLCFFFPLLSYILLVCVVVVVGFFSSITFIEVSEYKMHVK